MTATLCERWHQAMTARLFGELLELEARELDGHLAACGACQLHWARLTEHFDALRAQPRPSAPAGFAQALLERVIAPPRETGEAMAHLVMARGEITARGAAAREGDPVGEGETLHLAANARALLRLPDKSELWLNGGAVLRLARQAKATVVHLVRGELLAFVEKQRHALRVLTPDGSVEVLGTVFHAMLVPGHGTRVSVLRGRVALVAGASRREIDKNRQASLRGQREVSSAQRLSTSERRRLDAWSAPMRVQTMARESEALAQPLAMSTLSKAAGVAAAIGLALLAYSQFSPSGRPATPIAPATSQSDADEPAAVALASASAPVPSNWRQTLTMRGRVTQQDPGTAGLDFILDTETVTEARVIPGNAPGQHIVEHRIVEATVEPDLTGMSDQQAEVARVLMSDEGDAMKNIFMRETRDASGRRLSVEISYPEPMPHGWVPQAAVLQSLLGPPAGASPEQLVPGASWTHTFGLPSLEDLKLTTTAQVRGIEEFEGEQVALIHSETRVEHVPTAQGHRLSTRPGHPDRVAETFLQQFTFTWSLDSRHRLSDGQCVQSAGRFENTSDLRNTTTFSDGTSRSEVSHNEMNFETNATIEHHS